MDYREVFASFCMTTGCELERDLSSLQSQLQEEYQMEEDLTLKEILLANELVVTTGKLAVSSMVDDGHGFPPLIPPGRYPVILYVSYYEDDNCLPPVGRGVALAALMIKEVIPTTWKLAQREDGETSYATMFGEGSIMDATCIACLEERGERLGEICEAPISGDLYWISFDVDETSGLNIIVFASGSEMCPHTLYLGYDEEENVVCFLIDTNVLSRD